MIFGGAAFFAVFALVVQRLGWRPLRTTTSTRGVGDEGDDSGIMNPFGVFAKISLFTGALSSERVANDWWIVYVVILLEEEEAATIPTNMGE